MSMITLHPIAPNLVATPASGYKTVFINSSDGNLLYQKDEHGALVKISGMTLDGAAKYKGAIDCSTNPNYPDGKSGDMYTISHDGLIGGANGTSVDAGSFVICNTDNAGGTELAVGVYWDVIAKSTPQNASQTMVEENVTVGSAVGDVIITHGLNSKYPVVAVYDAVTHKKIIIDVEYIDVNSIYINSIGANYTVSLRITA